MDDEYGYEKQFQYGIRKQQMIEAFKAKMGIMK